MDYISREPQQDAAKISKYNEVYFSNLDAIKCGAKHFFLNTKMYTDCEPQNQHQNDENLINLNYANISAKLRARNQVVDITNPNKAHSSTKNLNATHSQYRQQSPNNKSIFPIWLFEVS